MEMYVQFKKNCFSCVLYGYHLLLFFLIKFSMVLYSRSINYNVDIENMKIFAVYRASMYIAIFAMCTLHSPMDCAKAVIFATRDLV